MRPDPSQLRGYTAEAIYAAMLDTLRQRGMQGSLPYEGQWLTLEEIRRRIRRRRLATWVTTLEVILLFVALTGVSAGLLGITYLLAF